MYISAKSNVPSSGRMYLPAMSSTCLRTRRDERLARPARSSSSVGLEQPAEVLERELRVDRHEPVAEPDDRVDALAAPEAVLQRVVRRRQHLRRGGRRGRTRRGRRGASARAGCPGATRRPCPTSYTLAVASRSSPSPRCTSPTTRAALSSRSPTRRLRALHDVAALAQPLVHLRRELRELLAERAAPARRAPGRAGARSASSCCCRSGRPSAFVAARVHRRTQDGQTTSSAAPRQPPPAPVPARSRSSSPAPPLRRAAAVARPARRVRVQFFELAQPRDAHPPLGRRARSPGRRAPPRPSAAGSPRSARAARARADAAARTISANAMTSPTDCALRTTPARHRQRHATLARRGRRPRCDATAPR